MFSCPTCAHKFSVRERIRLCGPGEHGCKNCSAKYRLSRGGAATLSVVGYFAVNALIAFGFSLYAALGLAMAGSILACLVVLPLERVR